MKRIAFVVVVLTMFSAWFSNAQEQYRPVLISIKPEIDIPLPPDSNLFHLDGGVAVSASYVFSFF